MSAALEQNPITHRIELMRLQWKDTVQDTTANLVRWLIQPDELKMVQAFCDLEQGEMAALPEMFLTLQTPFSSIDTYGDDLLVEWISRFEDNSQIEEAAKRGMNVTWDFQKYKKKGGSVFESILEHIQTCFPEFEECFCVYLNPTQCNSVTSFAKWIKVQLEHLPPRIRIIVHDYIGHEQFNSLMQSKRQVNIIPDLQMGNALQEVINQQANPNDHHAQFTKCILQMAEAAKQKDVQALNKFGELSLHHASKTKLNAMYLSAYMCWGLNLQLLKYYAESFEKYNTGIALAERVINEEGDETCMSVLIQLHSFKAANHIHLKEYDEGVIEYEIMALLSKEFKQPMMQMEAYRMAALYAPKSSHSRKLIPFLTDAFHCGKTLPNESLLYSQFPILSKELYEMTSVIQPELGDEIHQKMTSLIDENWLKKVNRDYFTDINLMKENQ